MTNDEYNDWAAEHGEPEINGTHTKLILAANGRCPECGRLEENCECQTVENEDEN